MPLERESGDPLYPRLIEGHPHVDAGQVGVRALDAVRDGAGQHEAPVRLLQHQRAAAVTLTEKERG